MRANPQDLQLYKAYSNAYDMMELREYEAEEPKRDFADFLELQASWSTNDPVIEFRERNYDPERDINIPPPYIVYVMFVVGKLAKDEMSPIETLLTNKISEFNPGRRVRKNEDGREVSFNPNGFGQCIQAILITTDALTSHAANVIKLWEPSIIPRAVRDYSVAMISARIFHLHNMQFNPLEHKLQPRFVKLITNEVEKEALRLRLIANSTDKAQTLFDLLPMMYHNDPVAKWYDAQVGDVFYCIRTIGGMSPYYRIVVPSHKASFEDK
jgi:DNA-directed RNA polymerase subunit H (RpoH/RPB5)